LRENLDDELDDIRGLLETKPARKPLPSQTSLFKKELVTTTSNGQNEEEKKDSLNDYSDYDKALRELAMDQRAQATDRTKTEEEIAMEEKEKLEKAELARKRRMEGLDSEDEDDEPKHKHHHKKRKAAAPQGDDLEDDYLEELEEEVERLGKGLSLEDIQGASRSKHDEDDDDMDEDDEEEGDDDGEDEDDEEDEEDDEELETDNEDLESDDEAPVFGDDDDDDMNEIGNAGVVKKAKAVKPTKQTEKKEIPYTFECPTTHGEFLEILQDLDVEDAVLVTKRIRVLYHIKLAQENKEKISTFLGVLVDHIAYIASTVSPLPTAVIDKLNMHAFDIAQQLPTAAATVFTDKLKAMQSNMSQKMKFSASSWPDIEDMALLRLLGQIFSTSDLTHPIATPAMLFMCQALSQCPIQNEIDLGRGLFLTLIAYEVSSILLT
jgi:nucleolar protein 14